MSSTHASPAPAAARWLPIQRYDLALQTDAVWTDAGNGVLQRDLGLGRASDGAMQGRELRCDGNERELPEPLRQAGTHFHLIQVLQGSVSLANADGSRTVLERGDCMHQPALAATHRVHLGADSRVLELAVPKSPSVAGQAFDLETPQRAAQAVINRDVAEAYVRGDGPRSYFLYRDLGVAAATNRRVHIHLLKATAPSSPGGTGEHRHTMCQLFYVLSGWADLEVEGHPTVRMRGGDAMCISAGSKHNVPAFSQDYAIIELCIPADYDTVDA